MILRPYQQKAVTLVNDGWGRGNTNMLLVSPTGSGKTVTMASIIHATNMPVCAIAHRQELVGQISMALAREGIVHRVIASDSVIRDIVRDHTEELGRNYCNPQSKVVVAGVDTLIRRKDKLESWASSVRLWVIDEAHHVLKANQWGKAVSMFPNAKGLGVTATPLRADGAGLGSHADGVFDEIVEGPSMAWLIANGYLSQYKLYAPTSDFDVNSVPLGKGGEFVQKKLRAASKSSHIVGDVVDNWVKFAKGLRTVVFTTDIEDAGSVAQRFKDVGVSAEALSSRNSHGERTVAIRKFKNGETTVLVNVDLFGEGFDLPAISCAVFARPTMSYGLYVQQFGRALRILDGKTHAVIIDHVGNIQRHGGPPDRPRVWSLERREKRGKGVKDPDLLDLRNCTNEMCFQLYERHLVVCPHCGHEPEPAGRSKPEEVDGDLEELTQDAIDQLYGPVKAANEPVANLMNRMTMAGAPSIAVNSAAKNQKRKQDVQKELREVMAMWGGLQKSRGLNKREAHKMFYLKFNIDVVSAQALGYREAVELIMKVGEELF